MDALLRSLERTHLMKVQKLEDRACKLVFLRETFCHRRYWLPFLLDFMEIIFAYLHSGFGIHFPLLLSTLRDVSLTCMDDALVLAKSSAQTKQLRCSCQVSSQGLFQR